jgi:hypothetical protein
LVASVLASFSMAVALVVILLAGVSVLVGIDTFAGHA